MARSLYNDYRVRMLIDGKREIQFRIRAATNMEARGIALARYAQRGWTILSCRKFR